MSVIAKLVDEGFRPESVISSMKGFEIMTFINPVTGERIVYWRRSGRITIRSVRRLKGLVRVPADRLVVEFTDVPSVDEEADRELKKMFKNVVYIAASKAQTIGERIKVTDNIYIVRRKVTRGTIRVGESSRVLDMMSKLSNRQLWLLVIRRKHDGTVEIIADSKTSLEEHIESAEERGEELVIFAIWHGTYSTDVFLVYPDVKQDKQI